MEAKLFLFYCFIITKLLLGIVECVNHGDVRKNHEIDKWFKKVDSPPKADKISKLYEEYCEFFNDVTHMKNGEDKLTCEVQLLFIPCWLLHKAEEDVLKKFIGSLKKQADTLTTNFIEEFDFDRRIPKAETAFKDYYTNERKDKISELLKEKKPDIKQAMKFALELVYFANKQFTLEKTELEFTDLICALEDINNMKKKFPQSSEFFDALSFFLRLITFYEFNITNEIGEWFNKVDSHIKVDKMSEIYKEYCMFFDIVTHITKEEDKKEACEVQLLFISYRLRIKAEKDVLSVFEDSITKQERTLIGNFEKKFGFEPKIPNVETAFQDYYTKERKDEISKLLKENTADIKQAKQAMKLALELVYFAYMQFLQDKTKFNFPDLKCALEDINNMEKKFPKSEDFFGELSFYFRLINIFEFNIAEKLDKWFEQLPETRRNRKIQVKKV